MANPRLLIAGTHSGVGKTTITLGVMASLINRGLTVQGYKVGPDYIDPSYHTFLTGRPSRNVDCWMLGANRVREIFERSSRDADLSVIEGVMGLYDGKEPLSNDGTTAEVSLILQTPVVLVIDAYGMARSAAAVVRGYQLFQPSVPIAGVIANRVGGEGHYRLVKAAIESTCQVPVVGYLPANPGLNVPERHLGLVPAIERGELRGLFEQLAEAVSATVNLDQILDIANRAGHLDTSQAHLFLGPAAAKTVTIAVARDAAFNFYYSENLELLEHHGARLVFFSPLAGQEIPAEADGLYIGGGFPEEFASELSRQTRTMNDIRQRIQAGLPTYAECGGFMYLSGSITDRRGQAYPMVGVIPASTTMQERLSGFGYREVQSAPGNWLLQAEGSARGHEFHYSTMAFESQQDPAYLVKEMGTQTAPEGYVHDNVVAGYTHLHFGSNPNIARQFVAICYAFQVGERGRAR